MKRLIYFLLFLLILFSQQEQNSLYFCPPCGCDKDTIVFSKPELCTGIQCGMILLKGNWEDYTSNSFWSSLFDKSILAFFYQITIYPAIAQGLILSCVLLFSLRKKRKANIFLSLLLVSITLQVLKYYLMEIRFDVKTGHNSLFFPLSYILAIGPSLYFYTRYLTFSAYKFKNKEVIHFIPAVIVSLTYLILFFQTGHEKHMMIHGSKFLTFAVIEQVLGILSSTIYAVYSVQLLNKHDHWMKNHLSDLTKLNLKWLKHVNYAVLFICFVWFTILCIDWYIMKSFVYDSENMSHHYYPIWIAMSFVIYWIGYISIRKPELLNIEVNVEEERQKSKKYPKKYSERLINLMEEKKLYLEQDFTLAWLATEANLSSKVVTDVLNQSLSKNFYTFVNEYRVLEFQQRLKNPKNAHLTLLSIAFDSGFSSKSAFNSIFKKLTGVTPIQYKNNMLKPS